ncbi:unnamed protein product [Polarella glacialis]|uniref:Uncharacterized protein n=1 Tax=Polarella glacialis TaxID=89957 RepID=A0A813EHK3_POLGL|nr:unnamed protein product [Polarella glacialis]CAE8678126.1 unnamed protein product [Polarella glacialis]
MMKSPFCLIFHGGFCRNGGAADARAFEIGSTMGGSITNPEEDSITKDKVLWFSYRTDKINKPGAFDKGDPNLRIAALETLAATLLVHYIREPSWKGLLESCSL